MLSWTDFQITFIKNGLKEQPYWTETTKSLISNFFSSSYRNEPNYLKQAFQNNIHERILRRNHIQIKRCPITKKMPHQKTLASSNPQPSTQTQPMNKTTNSSFQEQSKPSCAICNQVNNVHQCKKFTNMSIDDRQKAVQENKLCLIVWKEATLVVAAGTFLNAKNAQVTIRFYTNRRSKNQKKNPQTNQM